MNNSIPTMGERVAVIEQVVLRMESKLDKHIAGVEKSISRLERFAAWSSGAVFIGAIWLKQKLHLDL